MMKIENSKTFDPGRFFVSIEEGRLHEVKKILRNNPSLRNVCDSNGESSVAKALKSQQFSVYKLLLSNGFNLKPTEDLNLILEENAKILGKESDTEWKVENKALLRRIHNQCVKNLKPNYLQKLEFNSKLSHTTRRQDSDIYYKFVETAFYELNELRWIKPILKIVASINLTIVFDFNHGTVEHMDPAKNKFTHGTSYLLEDYIYVGAKKLLNDEERFDVLGCLAHELCHFAMLLLYKNDCKPYFASDVEIQSKFDEIVNSCEKNKNVEELIGYAYKSPEYLRHIELIVRVPQLIAMYKEESEKHFECSEVFSALYDFYEENTLVDLEREAVLIEERDKIKEINKFFGILAILETSANSSNSDALSVSLDVTDRVLVIFSNCPMATMNAIYQKKRNEKDFESHYVFMSLKAISNDDIFDQIEEIFNLSISPTLIIDCDDMTHSEVLKLSQKLVDGEMIRRILFVANQVLDRTSFPHTFCLVGEKHTFHSFPKEFQKYFMQPQIIFKIVKKHLNEKMLKALLLIRALKIVFYISCDLVFR